MEPAELKLDELRRYVERGFRHVAEAKNVDFFIRLDPKLPKAMFADPKRLQQVLKNLLSNAFKFTHEGHVTLAIEPATSGWNPQNENLNRASEVVAFSVTDTGIGISHDKQQIIFEAFQQADGSTNRKFGGTGLGLAISRELSRLLGGEIRLVSAPRAGSTFTLYLPIVYTPPSRPARAGAGGDGRSPARFPAATRHRPAMRPPTSASRSTTATARAVEGEAASRTTARDSPPPSNGSSTKWETTANAVEPGDDVLLIVENDVAFARLVLETARESGFKGHRRDAGRGRPGSRRAVQAVGHHARSLPARYRRLARPEQAEARRRDPAHSRCRHHFNRRCPRTGASFRGPCVSSASRSRTRKCSRTLLTDVKRFIGPPERSLLIVARRSGAPG